MEVSVYEVLVYSVVASLGVVHDLGCLQSPPFQISPHDACKLGGLFRIIASSTFRKTALEASLSLASLRIACTYSSSGRLELVSQSRMPVMTLRHQQLVPGRHFLLIGP